MATVLLPRSLLALFPGAERRHEVEGEDVAAIIDALEARIPGVRDRLVEGGPRPPRQVLPGFSQTLWILVDIENPRLLRWSPRLS